MRNRIAQIEESQFITKEFADALAGKQPHPYLRRHDVVQQEVLDKATGPYRDRMIHFWREVSLAGMRIDGPGMDECFALLFESVFDRAEAEPDWAAQIYAETEQSNHKFTALKQLKHQLCHPISHQALVNAFWRCYAPLREQERCYENGAYNALLGQFWFWAAMTCAVGIDEDHPGWAFRRDLAECSANFWGDKRLHTRLIREAPQRATATPRGQLMAHPILRLARLKYDNGSVEQEMVLKFLNSRCIKEGFSSEEDYFGSDLKLALWFRDARSWAEQILLEDANSCSEMCEAYGFESVEDTRRLFRNELGLQPSEVDDLDAADCLIKWAKRQRGLEFSKYRAQLWEFVVEIVDSALWLGWLYPRGGSLLG